MATMAGDTKRRPSEEDVDVYTAEDTKPTAMATATETPVVPMPEALQSLAPEELAAIQRKATFKLDVVIMPCLMIMYILNYLDRQNIASAKLAKITDDLGMNDTEYQTCVSIIFVGYILMQIPSNMVLSKITYPGIYICAAMALWGVISGAQSAVKSFGGLVVARFFIGFVEAVFFPGALFYLSMFYTRKQFAFRVSLFYSGSQLGNAFGGLFAIALLKLDGRSGLVGWRWLFLVEGIITVGLALLFMLILPNSLERARGLNEMERLFLRWNYDNDQGQKENKNEITAWKGLMLGVQDPKTWMMMAILYLIYTSAAVNNFFPSVVSTLGYSQTMTYVLTAPPFLLCCLAMLVVGFHSDRKQERYWHIVSPLFVTVIANVIAISTLNTAARYTAMMLMPGSFYASSTVLLSWLTGTLNQPVAKRASSMALINAVCNTPNIWTAYIYIGEPRYLAAFIVNLVAAAAAIGVATFTRFYLQKQNRLLDSGIDTGKNGPTEAQKASNFRYML